MKLQPYIEKLNSSKEYKAFTEKHNDAFMVAGFFILDLETGQNLHQIDYYIPSEKKVAAFTLDKAITLQLMQYANKKVPTELDIKTRIDLEALEGILQDEMKNRGMSEEIKKIIAVVQNVEGKKTWILNCVLSGMEILKAHVEDKSKTVLKMEKISMSDIIKHIPPSAMKQLQQAKKGLAPKKISTKDKLEKLKEMEATIEKEKAKLKDQALKKEKNSKN